MDKINNTFKYKSPFLKFGHICLILGIILSLTGYLMDKSFILISLGVALAALAILLFYLLYFILYINFFTKIKKYTAKYNLDEIKAEMCEPTTYTLYDAYLTRNYIVAPNNGNLFICKYSELLWIFKNVVSYNGIQVSRGVNGYVNDDKQLQYIFVNIPEGAIEKVFEFILSRNPNVLIGFTKENKETYKSIRNTI